MIRRIRDSVLIGLILFSVSSRAQEPDTVKRLPRPLVSGGIYDKPFIARLGGKTTIGGYMDAVGSFGREMGINEGWSFEARRFNLFTYSVIADGIVVTSEIEFEQGGEEIKLEYGLLDIEFNEAFTLRGGVILSPLGKTNLVHDSPKLELVDRPLVMTEIIPSTLSEAGIGLFGALYPSDLSRLTYEFYVVNGFNQDIIENSAGTRIAEGKGKLFEEDNNGEPAVVGRIAFSPEFATEIGASLHTGAYNIFKADGLKIDSRRSLTILAFDAEHNEGWVQIQAEYALAEIQVPPSLRAVYAQKQHGFFIQTNLPLWGGLFSRWPRSKFNASVRFDFVDFDRGQNGDDHSRLTVGLNFRPVQDSVLKLNYEQNWILDRDVNVTRSVRFLVSLASYF